MANHWGTKGQLDDMRTQYYCKECADYKRELAESADLSTLYDNWVPLYPLTVKVSIGYVN